MTKPELNNDKGGFFVIEGTDGSGKGTQSKILVDRLRCSGLRCGRI
jgi:thymidylate kinase